MAKERKPDPKPDPKPADQVSVAIVEATASIVNAIIAKAPPDLHNQLIGQVGDIIQKVMTPLGANLPKSTGEKPR
jgi:hypothetical protein